MKIKVPNKGEKLRKVKPVSRKLNDYYANGWNDCVDFIKGKGKWSHETK